MDDERSDLTDLLEAHAVVDMALDGGGVQCKCQPRPMDGTCMWSPEDQAEHLASVVEQHTNRRIAELEADSANWKSYYDDAKQVIEAGTVNWTATIHDRDDWKARAEKAEAMVARFREIRCGICGNPLSEGSGNCASDAGRPHVYDEADLRAALEGEADADPT